MSGAGSQNGGISRWGDYSGLTIDPIDDCTFWYTNEYLQMTGSFNWSTRVASFKFPDCIRPSVAVSGAVTLNLAIQLITGVPSGATVQCELTLTTLDALGPIKEDVVVIATVSGTTATCAAPIPYLWTLSTPTTDMISVRYTVAIVPSGATIKSSNDRHRTRTLPGIIGVPASGTQTALSDTTKL